MMDEGTLFRGADDHVLRDVRSGVRPHTEQAKHFRPLDCANLRGGFAPLPREILQGLFAAAEQARQRMDAAGNKHDLKCIGPAVFLLRERAVA